jgi:hypothetical protein
MPSAQFPTTPRGWLAAVLSSMIGFLAGLWSLKLLGNLL